MARKYLGATSWPPSCGEGKSSCRTSGTAGCVGTWLKLAAVGLALFAAGAVASSPSTMQPGQSKYNGFREFSWNVRSVFEFVKVRFQGTDVQIYNEMNSCPPKPLQVFEYGPSRPAWMRDPKKYKYQYVCVVATTGSVEEGIWHRRKAPRRWTHQPPFHVRIVRPSPAGLLDIMMTKKKVKLVEKDVTITRTDKRTGEVFRRTKKMTRLERCKDGKMPKHVAEMLRAEVEGREWKDTRATKGRWGPSNLKEAEEEGVLELMAEAGIETPEEMEDVHKVVDPETGEKFDLRRYMDIGEFKEGYKALTKADEEVAKEERRKTK
ncbi:unnamed protein product [Pylaiella littoralis]